MVTQWFNPDARYDEDGHRMGEFDRVAGRYYSGEVLEANDNDRDWGWLFAIPTCGLSLALAEFNANDRRLTGKVNPW
ncbi:hypothetical protein [Floridanema aerugineum]|uniref:Uncharacterized protein n=1 Tax=Floridaenema aerugineum BLCC-F46 TaxID=3153654 RepID=A0ABV4X2B2_9CYAN